LGTLLDELQETERNYVEGENQKPGDDKASNSLAGLEDKVLFSDMTERFRDNLGIAQGLR
jgi:hypothetical protein